MKKSNAILRQETNIVEINYFRHLITLGSYCEILNSSKHAIQATSCFSIIKEGDLNKINTAVLQVLQWYKSKSFIAKSQGRKYTTLRFSK